MTTGLVRFFTREINMGNIPLGGDNPIRVQSMTNTDTMDIDATVDQVVRLAGAGCEYIRIAVPGMKHADVLRIIKNNLRQKGIGNPIIADVHFQPGIAEKVARFVEKVRINPGNYIGNPHLEHDDDVLEQISGKLGPLLRICKQYGTAIRIGVNHGSLSRRILNRFGDTPEGMVESALEFARICVYHGFNDLILSLKSSQTRTMIRANRLLVEKMKVAGMNFPVHLGVTEAGSGEDGRLKSAIGIGSLLADGIGDTIRVSLTGEPVDEIPVAYGILQATGVRIIRTEFISCPTCARTHFNILQVLSDIKENLAHLKGLKIAVMGCVVNGPGEMAGADYGYVGGSGGKIMLYRKDKLVKKNIEPTDALQELIHLIRENGDWIDP